MANDSKNWITSFSKKKNRVYYFNIKTNESLWEKPPELLDEDLELRDIVSANEKKKKDQTETLKINTPLTPHKRCKPHCVASNSVNNVNSVPQKKIDLREKLQRRNKKSLPVHERITRNLSKKPKMVYPVTEHEKKVQEDAGQSHKNNNSEIDILSTSLSDIIKHKKLETINRTELASTTKLKPVRKKRKKKKKLEDCDQLGNCETAMEWEDIIEDSNNHVEKPRLKMQQTDWFNFYFQKWRYNNVQNTFDADVVIVLDTNVLLSSLKLINNLKDLPFDEFPAKFIVPYNVLSELDHLKMNKGNKYTVIQAAKLAISTLHEDLQNNHPRIIGQKAENHNVENLYTSTENDNFIINCCLQYQKLGYNVVLFTHDKNLISRALMNDIQSVSKKELNHISTIISNGAEGNIQGISGCKRTGFGRTDPIPVNKHKRISFNASDDESRPNVSGNSLKEDIHPGNSSTSKNQPLCVEDEDSDIILEDDDSDIHPGNSSTSKNQPLYAEDEDSDIILEDDDSDFEDDILITSQHKNILVTRTEGKPNNKHGKVSLQPQEDESGYGDSITSSSTTSHLDKGDEGNIQGISGCKRTVLGRTDPIPVNKHKKISFNASEDESRPNVSGNSLIEEIETSNISLSENPALLVENDESENSDILLEDEDDMDLVSEKHSDSLHKAVSEETLFYPEVSKTTPENAHILVFKLKRALIYFFDNVIKDQSLFKDARLKSVTDSEATDLLYGLICHLQLHWKEVTKRPLLEQNIIWILTLRKILLIPVEGTTWTEKTVNDLMDAVNQVTDILKSVGVHGIIKNTFTLALLDCQDVEYQLKKEIFGMENPVRKVGTMRDVIIAQGAFNTSWRVIQSFCNTLSSVIQLKKQNPENSLETDEVEENISRYYKKVSDILEGLNGILKEDVNNLNMFHPSILLLYNSLSAIVPESWPFTLENKNDSSYKIEEQFFICDLNPRSVLAYCVRQENRLMLIDAKDSFARYLSEISKCCDDYILY